MCVCVREREREREREKALLWLFLFGRVPIASFFNFWMFSIDEAVIPHYLTFFSIFFLVCSIWLPVIFLTFKWTRIWCRKQSWHGFDPISILYQRWDEIRTYKLKSSFITTGPDWCNYLPIYLHLKIPKISEVDNSTILQSWKTFDVDKRWVFSWNEVFCWLFFIWYTELTVCEKHIHLSLVYGSLLLFAFTSHRRSLQLLLLLLLSKSFCQSLTPLCVVIVCREKYWLAMDSETSMFNEFCFYPLLLTFVSLHFTICVYLCCEAKKGLLKNVFYIGFPSKNSKNVILNRKCIWIGLSCLFNLI